MSLLPCSKSCSEASKDGWSSKRISSSCSLDVAMLALALGVLLFCARARSRVVADVQSVEVGKGQGREGDEGARGDGDGDEGDVEAVLDGEDGHDLPSRGWRCLEKARDP